MVIESFKEAVESEQDLGGWALKQDRGGSLR